MAMLRWSDDGGHAWSDEYWREIGKKGKYKNRAKWKKMGGFWERIWEWKMTDPVPRRIIGAYLEGQVGRV